LNHKQQQKKKKEMGNPFSSSDSSSFVTSPSSSSSSSSSVSSSVSNSRSTGNYQSEYVVSGGFFYPPIKNSEFKRFPILETAVAHIYKLKSAEEVVRMTRNELEEVLSQTNYRWVFTEDLIDQEDNNDLTDKTDRISLNLPMGYQLNYREFSTAELAQIGNIAKCINDWSNSVEVDNFIISDDDEIKIHKATNSKENVLKGKENMVNTRTWIWYVSESEEDDEDKDEYDYSDNDEEISDEEESKEKSKEQEKQKEYHKQKEKEKTKEYQKSKQKEKEKEKTKEKEKERKKEKPKVIQDSQSSMDDDGDHRKENLESPSFMLRSAYTKRLSKCIEKFKESQQLYESQKLGLKNLPDFMSSEEKSNYKTMVERTWDQLSLQEKNLESLYDKVKDQVKKRSRYIKSARDNCDKIFLKQQETYLDRVESHLKSLSYVVQKDRKKEKR
jgi:hypothetical protein